MPRTSMCNDDRRRLCIAQLRFPRRVRFAAMIAFGLMAVNGIYLPVAAQTPTPTQQTKQAPPPAQGTTPATVVDDQDIETVLGKEIYSPKGEDMGQIVDVLVDHKGQVRGAIIDFGGFLGVGNSPLSPTESSCRSPATKCGWRRNISKASRSSYWGRRPPLHRRRPHLGLRQMLRRQPLPNS
jgi:hypothetical protein